MRCFSSVMLSFVDKLQRFSTVVRFGIQGFCYLLHTEKATALSRKDKKGKKIEQGLLLSYQQRERDRERFSN